MLHSPLRAAGASSDSRWVSHPLLFGLALCQPLLITAIKLTSAEAAAGAPFLLFSGSIVFAAALAGATAGIVATALSAALSSFLFMEPMGAFAAGATEVGQLATFVVEGALVSVITGALRARALKRVSHTRSLVGWARPARPPTPHVAETTSPEPAAVEKARGLRAISLVSCGDISTTLARIRQIPLGQRPAVSLIRILPMGVASAVRPVAERALRSDLDALTQELPEATVSAEVRSVADADELADLALQRPELVVVDQADASRRWHECRRVIETKGRHGVPVLILSGLTKEPYRRLLIAIESPAQRSSRGVELALALTPSATELHVLHVLNRRLERRMAQAGAPYRAILRARRDLRSTTRRQLMTWLTAYPDARVGLESAEPADVILETARRIEPDLVALSVEDRWLKDWTWDRSVASKVVRDAGADVLIVRTR